jgi:hypothetical protein
MIMVLLSELMVSRNVLNWSYVEDRKEDYIEIIYSSNLMSDDASDSVRTGTDTSNADTNTGSSHLPS